jgi:hypothetical protein
MIRRARPFSGRRRAMSGIGRGWRLIWCAGLLLLAACTTVPAPPLLSPLATTGGYGYAERPIGASQYEVTYLGPTQRTSRYPPAQAADAAAARKRAEDMLLWRSAQLAEQQGDSGFRVAQTRSNTQTYVEQYPDDPFWGPPFGPWYGPRHFGYWPSPAYVTTWVYLQPQVTANVTLLKKPGPGDYVAADVIEQLRRTYPGADGVPVAPPPSATPPPSIPPTS